MRYQLFLLIVLASFATAEIQNVSAQSDSSPKTEKPKEGDKKDTQAKKDAVALAVIVHPKNSIKNTTRASVELG